MPTQDPPSSRIRSIDSPPRRRVSDPNIRRREDDRTRGNSWVKAFLTVSAGVLFLGYVFNVMGFATSADAFVQSLHHSAQAKQDAALHVVSVLYPALGLLVIAIVLFSFLRAFFARLMRSKKNKSQSERKAITLETFRRVAGARGIRPRVATQAYELLLPFYQESMRGRLEDRMVEDLGMKPSQVVEVYAMLLRKTDRKPSAGDVPILRTVLELLQATQNAQRQSLLNAVVLPTVCGQDADGLIAESEAEREFASR